MIDDISAHKSQMVFMVVDFEADKPRMNAELWVIMTDFNWVQIKLNLEQYHMKYSSLQTETKFIM